MALLGLGRRLEDFKRLLEEQGTERVIVDQSADEHVADMGRHVSRLVAADRARYQNTLVSFFASGVDQLRAGPGRVERCKKGHIQREGKGGGIQPGMQRVGWRFNESLERLIEMALSDGVKVVALDAEAGERIRLYRGFSCASVGARPTNLDLCSLDSPRRAPTVRLPLAHA
ncbi:MAG: hypothetical protein KY393_09015 [Actinobacteria bacterium]|nr:hypothetical protein [Actinomycetota bacterium]